MKARYRDNEQINWKDLDGKKLTIQVSSGYIVGVEANGLSHVLLIGVRPRDSKPRTPTPLESDDGQATV